MNHPVSIAVVALFSLLACSAHYQEMPQVYCGRSLARAIAVMCYEAGPFEKRSDSGTMYNGLLVPYYKEQETQPNWPWLAPHKAKGLSMPSRGKRQVVDECCNKACSVSELLSYC